MVYRLLFICLILSSCSNSRMIQTDLYFAQITPAGEEITPGQWSEFKEKQISRVFINGSTTHTATGTWFDPEKKILITEPTYVVTYFYKRSKKISNQIDSLVHIYKTTFKQQSVLRVDKKVRARF